VLRSYASFLWDVEEDDEHDLKKDGTSASGFFTISIPSARAAGGRPRGTGGRMASAAALCVRSNL
jgi:hypothetical protein